jgi:hypothetical protein
MARGLRTRPYSALRDAVISDHGAIRDTIMSRSTQTNEVGQLATLMPAFASLGDGQPLALLEVGASAGANYSSVGAPSSATYTKVFTKLAWPPGLN